METQQSTLAPTTEEHLTFDIGGQGYAVSITAVREIRGWTEPSGMPEAEPHVMGVINLRGEVLPLLDLAAKLGLDTPEINERSVIIVVEAGDQTVGLFVDSVSNIVATDKDEMKDPPEAPRNGETCYVSALTLIDEKIVRILNIAAVLENEKQIFSEAI